MSNGRSRSSFYWAMRLMPRERRRAMFAIYDFARALDDIADGAGSADARHAALTEWRAEIGRLYANQPTRDLTRALAPAIARFGLPRQEFEQLIRGMEMDVEGPLVAPPRAVLDLYCRRVAGSVGLLALPVFGAAGAAERELALYLGRALQLTNILRDLETDAALGRLYVPGEHLAAAGIDARDPADVLCDSRFPAATRLLAKDAARAFAAAERQFAVSDRRAMWPAAAMLGAYRALLARLDCAGYRAGRSVRLSRLQTLGAALRAVVAAQL